MSTGSVGGTAQKYGSAVRAGNSGVARMKRTVNVSPRATTPEAVVRFPARTSAAPTMWRVNNTPGDFIEGASVRLIARANALEENVSLYYTTNGKRNTIKYVDAPVPLNTWHTLRVEFAGKRIKVILNGKTYIEQDDSHIGGSGAVGVWTKADSVTQFDDLTIVTK